MDMNYSVLDDPRNTSRDDDPSFATHQAEEHERVFVSWDLAVNSTFIEVPEQARSCSATIFLAVVLGVIVILTIAGNALVISSIVVNGNLRTTTYYFIANLAIADLLLGTTVLPFSATLEVLQYWAFGQIFCDVWAAIDVLCCTASILSLCVISIDR